MKFVIKLIGNPDKYYAGHTPVDMETSVDMQLAKRFDHPGDAHARAIKLSLKNYNVVYYEEPKP